jgi:diguanylate cyclase (GGDEF)-like protein
MARLTDMTGSLADLVTSAATQLMVATASNYVAVSERVLADVVSHFRVDVGFLRHNDHTIHASVLVAEWPPRANVPDPDPIGVVYFGGADSVFATVENLKAPHVVRPEPGNADYQRLIEEGSSIPTVSLAYVPLLSGDVTTGTLGFVGYGDRDWLPEELHALQVIATLFAQLQARVVAEERLRYLADHDDLTGLVNRRALIAYLDDRLTEGRPGPVTVLYVDIDRLQVVVDQVGHNAGDRFIKGFADLLREAAGVPSVIARFAGDEFVVVLAAPMDINSARVFAESLQNRVQQPIVIDDAAFTRTVSIGVAAAAPGSDSTTDLLRRADYTVQFAKGSGGGTVAAFNPEMSERYAIRNDVELHLEWALDSDPGAFVVHYLPVFDMRTGEVLGTEALIRWRHPSRGLLMPDSFIEVAESANLMGKLGHVVAHSAGTQFVQWRSRGVGRNATLHLNMSPGRVMSEGFVDRVAANNEEWGLDSSAACIEITEGALLSDIDVTYKTLAGLKDLGIQIAIDDFGTGYSGLTYLKSLPVDILKIDKGFVRDLGVDAGDLAIVRSIMALADAFKLEVIAEGVETPAAARTLLDLGCTRAQGFLFSRPLDGAAMEALFAKRFIPVDFVQR